MISPQTNDQLALSAQEKIESKLALLEKNKVEKKFKTNMIIYFDSNGNFASKTGSASMKNLLTITEEEQLVQIYTKILMYESYSTQAARELNVDISDEKFSGYSLTEWKADILHLCNYIKYNKEVNRLKSMLQTVDSKKSETLKNKEDLENILSII